MVVCSLCFSGLVSLLGAVGFLLSGLTPFLGAVFPSIIFVRFLSDSRFVRFKLFFSVGLSPFVGFLSFGLTPLSGCRFCQLLFSLGLWWRLLQGYFSFFPSLSQNQHQFSVVAFLMALLCRVHSL